MKVQIDAELLSKLVDKASDAVTLLENDVLAKSFVYLNKGMEVRKALEDAIKEVTKEVKSKKSEDKDD